MSSSRLVSVDGASSAATLGAVPSTLVVGNFDGVHRGHQTVLRQAVADAKAESLTACVLTFDPHPAVVVGSGAPPLLTTLERRAELFGEAGVERTYVRRFDRDFSSWSPERFARDLVSGILRARVVVVGENFRFGSKRAGDLTLLRTLGASLGFEARVHAVASDAGGPFSSTRAREAIARGDLDAACSVLGRPHALTGAVVHGDHRGRTIDVPTANLAEIPELLPRDGVYAVRVDRFDEPAHEFRPLGRGVTNVGMRPTVGGLQRRVETHLVGFEGDLYGSRLRLYLVARVRDETKFDSMSELRAQIDRDIRAAEELLRSSGPCNPQPLGP
jgi:riboflavin kinase/FMN adenylyltransferase